MFVQESMVTTGPVHLDMQMDQNYESNGIFSKLLFRPCSSLKLTLKAIGVDQILAFLVAFDAAVGAPNNFSLNDGFIKMISRQRDASKTKALPENCLSSITKR
uniref:Uncharacterized protein n=1 Tax=Romanomermis culicivorax TaxID=13658 RepID=A0A915IJ59_ROMCU